MNSCGILQGISLKLFCQLHLLCHFYFIRPFQLLQQVQQAFINIQNPLGYSESSEKWSLTERAHRYRFLFYTHGVSGKTGVFRVWWQSHQQSNKQERRNDRRHPQNYSVLQNKKFYDCVLTQNHHKTKSLGLSYSIKDFQKYKWQQKMLLFIQWAAEVNRIVLICITSGYNSEKCMFFSELKA